VEEDYSLKDLKEPHGLWPCHFRGKVVNSHSAVNKFHGDPPFRSASLGTVRD